MNASCLLPSYSEKYVNFFSKILCSQLEKKTHWKTLFFESVFFKDETQNIFLYTPTTSLKKLINFLATLTKTSTLLTK